MGRLFVISMILELEYASRHIKSSELLVFIIVG